MSRTDEFLTFLTRGRDGARAPVQRGGRRPPRGERPVRGGAAPELRLPRATALLLLLAVLVPVAGLSYYAGSFAERSRPDLKRERTSNKTAWALRLVEVPRQREGDLREYGRVLHERKLVLGSLWYRREENGLALYMGPGDSKALLAHRDRVSKVTVGGRRVFQGAWLAPYKAR